MSVLVLDNASIHHSVCEELENLVNTRGARFVWLPPYSSMFNPIEAMFKYLKTWLIWHYGWVCEDVERGIECAMIEAVTRRNAAKQYEHSGYRASPAVVQMLQPLVQEAQPTWLYH